MEGWGKMLILVLVATLKNFVKSDKAKLDVISSVVCNKLVCCPLEFNST